MKFDPEIPYKVPSVTKKRLKEIEMAVAEDTKQARTAIAEIRGFISALPGTKSALMSPLFLKEAVESSEIEDINTTLLEVLQRQVAPDPSKTDNSQLVVNYLFAMRWGIENVDKFGISTRLVRGVQDRLLPRAAEGYRRVPVVIGDGRKKVHYSPPNAQDINDLMSEWEKLSGSDAVDPLVLAAVAHYQFEAIHPFEDGNGRTGRMIMTLQLVDAGLLQSPVIHISQYINANKSRYYRLLRAVTINDSFEDFVKYMIKGFTKQAVHSLMLLKQIQGLKTAYKREIRLKYSGIYSYELIEAMFARAVQTPVQLSKDIGTHYVTASKYLKILEEAGYLHHVKHGRHSYFINHKLLDLIGDMSPMDIERET